MVDYGRVGCGVSKKNNQVYSFLYSIHFSNEDQMKFLETFEIFDRVSI